MSKLLADILIDLVICDIEGWCKHDYLNALVELINGIGRNPTANARRRAASIKPDFPVQGDLFGDSQQ